MLVQGGFLLRTTRVLRKHTTKQRHEDAPRNPQAKCITLPCGKRNEPLGFFILSKPASRVVHGCMRLKTCELYQNVNGDAAHRHW